jgi:hypothetical protein
MPDDFNQHDAENRHYEQMRELQAIRDDLNKELNYYYDIVPKGESDERAERMGMYDRFANISDRLRNFLQRLK